MNDNRSEILGQTITSRYTYMNTEQKQTIVKMLNKHLSGHYEWSGGNTDAINIFLMNVKQGNVI